MAYDPTDPTSTGYPTGGGGLLGDLSGNPLFNFGVGLLSTVGRSREPQSGLGNVGKALAYASTAQQEAQKNELVRAKLAENARQVAAQGSLQKLIQSGGITPPEGMTPDAFGQLIIANPDLAAKYIPQAMSPADRALAMAGYPAILKAEQDVRQTDELRGIEKVTSNTTLKNAVEADQILSRLEKGPIPPGSNAASIVKAFSDPDGYISVPPATVAKNIAAFTGKPMSNADAAQFSHDWNRLVKLQSKFITDQRNLQAAQQANASTGGRTTDFGLSFIEKQNISPFTDPKANREIIRDLINRQKEVAQVRGWTLPDQALGDDLLKRYEKELAPTEPGTPDAPGAAPPPGDAGTQASGVLGGIYNRLFGPAAAPPPAVGAPPAGPPGGLPPGYAVAPTPSGVGAPMLPDGGVQNGRFVAQPAASPVTTTPGAGVPPKQYPMAFNPRTNAPDRVWPRPADGKRAIIAASGPDAVGRSFIAVDPKTKKPTVFTIEASDLPGGR
jgi:hypothetical protein